MPARTGQQYLEGLKAPRNVWVDGARVTDVAGHPALTGAAHALADVFDLQHTAADLCLFPDPETGEPINISHIIPRSRDDLKRRHAGIERIAEYSVGLMGRTPDYLNVTFAGFAGDRTIWNAHGNQEGAARLVDYQKKLRREDLALTHTIVSASADKALGDNPGTDVELHKVEDTSQGILVRGARVLATLAPFADEIAVYPRPIPERTDRHAVCFCIPLSTPGLKFICRDGVQGSRNRFDHPLSSRFDEQDAFVVFDDVEVPRDRVFIDGNLPSYNSVASVSWAPNISHQAMIRATVKLDFAFGLALRMAETINAMDPASKQAIGEIWAYSEFARSAVLASEEGAHEHADGMWIPDIRPLMAMRGMLPFWFPRINDLMRQLGSHFMLATPRAADFADPDLRGLIDKYLGGADGIDAERRARVFRLAWDFAGTALAMRNEQYERFYLASGPRNLQRAPFISDRSRADALVDRFLEEDYEPE